MNVVFLAYRDWALRVVDYFLFKDNKVNVITVIKTLEEYQILNTLEQNSIDFVILLGWSHIIKKPLLEKFNFVGVHPSKLPEYAGGSPLQHQIINGLTSTYCSLFSVNEKVDAGEILHMVPLSLRGDSISEVFDNLERSSLLLLVEFFNGKHLDFKYEPNNPERALKRRTPEQSEINYSLFNLEDIEPLYNFIRALTSPYPNAFILDKKGNKIFFEKIRFEASKKQ
jgi:methionyl-tRNA formyltransferase